MSVIAVFNVQMRPFRGYDDPALPSAQWVGFGFALGDVSAGTMEVHHVFEPVGQPLSGRIFSLEQYYATRTGTTPATWGMRSQNMDRFSNTLGPANFHWAGEMRANVVETTIEQKDLRLPIFLGGAATIPSAAFLQIFINNLNGETLRAGAMGYVWTPRSTLADGGPQRPPNGLYSA